MRRLTVPQARRIALAAQGFAAPRPTGQIDRRHFRRVFDHVGVLQLDSVNVVARSHYLPVLARLGRYDRDALDRYTTRSGEVFEYWAHMASLLPIETFPLYRHAMHTKPMWRDLRKVEAEHPDYVESVYEEIAAHGPLTVSDLANPGTRTGPWWGYGPGKLALEWLFMKGRLTSYRDRNFTRVYDITERVIPAHLLDGEMVPKEEAYRRLLLRAARHHGVGTAADLADYYRIHVPTSRVVLEELARSGRLVRVDVADWKGPVYMHPDATIPRRAHGTALLSPFDSLVWHRGRTERLFGFHYRIEIYVPEPKRVHGYYVLPFLLDGDIVARVDLKADRRAGALQVRAAHLEDGRDPVPIAEALAAELGLMATWLGMADVVVERRGDLADRLGRAVG